MKIKNNVIFKMGTCLVWAMIFLWPPILSGQHESKSGEIKLSIGASYGIAPSLQLNHRESSGNFTAFYGDALVNKKFIGRVQYSQLIVSSLSDDLENFVKKGWSFNGSLGYNLTFLSIPAMQIPLMGTLGYASITRTNTAVDPGMQIGLTVAPKYFIHEKMAINTSFRYLKGIEIDESSRLSQTDISLGMVLVLN